MKKPIVMIICVFNVAFVCSVSAQTNTRGQTQQPAAVTQAQAQQPTEVKTIFAYKKELALSDNQEKDMKDILTKFQDYLIEKRKEINKLSSELSDMIKNKTNLKQIKAKIDAIARLQADASYSDVETSRKIEDVLTKTQLAKWKKIQEDFQKEIAVRAQTAQENKAPTAPAKAVEAPKKAIEAPKKTAETLKKK